jgi:hypothetical protein
MFVSSNYKAPQLDYGAARIADLVSSCRSGLLLMKRQLRQYLKPGEPYMLTIGGNLEWRQRGGVATPPRPISKRT